MRLCVLFLSFALLPFPAFGQADFTRQLISEGKHKFRKAKAPRRGPASAPVNEELKSEIAVEVPPVARARPAEAPSEPSLLENVSSVFGNGASTLGFYRDHLHPNDVRLNKVEIQVVPGYSSIESRSDYSYRSFKTSFTNIGLRSNVWFAPLIGLSGALRFSLGGSLRSDSNAAGTDPVRDESMDLSLKTRHFFGLSPQSSNLEFGLHYLDHLFNVPSASTSHLRARTSGLAFSTRYIYPTSKKHAFVLGALLAPQLQHAELTTVSDASAGESPRNSLYGFDIGGEWRFSRENQILYGVNLTSEKNDHRGSASLPDPRTNSTPSNVTVTNNAVNFSFGYRWGH